MPGAPTKREGRRLARRLKQRLRRDERLQLQEIQARVDREAGPRNDMEPLPRID
ncbi:hypothetical protein [Acidovorax sp. NCPPB 4044]|uniref:hypothetical protein n=1 Tax=Acidovorax sp. NCPPB 4044 TaxID=2940490 RepID=UPI0023024FE4|nr:hypothetical protein [Acidovorax sp. NCPPB 4044]MDA8522295.1 hypothetical protein [Acidovorax sp. NCPPB 4044]